MSQCGGGSVSIIGFSRSTGMGVATDKNGQWLVAFVLRDDSLGGTIGAGVSDDDVVIVRSIDNAATWTSPTPAHSSAKGTRGRALDPQIEHDGTSWMLAWADTNTFSKVAGEDYDIAFMPVTDDCPTSPFVGCTSEIESSRSSLRLKNPAGAKDDLYWKFNAGAATTAADFDDPIASDGYLVCLYDEAAAVAVLKLELDMPGHGSLCKGKACWKNKSGKYRYTDRPGDQGAIQRAVFQPGAAGDTKFKIKAGHFTLGPPNTPLDKDPAVRIQVRNLGNGQCWESSFASATTNSSTEFAGKSD